MYRNGLLPQNHFRHREACRHLLRRVRDSKKRYGWLYDGNAIEKIVTSGSLSTFTDAYVDAVIHPRERDPATSDRRLGSGYPSRDH